MGVRRGCSSSQLKALITNKVSQRSSNSAPQLQQRNLAYISSLQISNSRLQYQLLTEIPVCQSILEISYLLAHTITRANSLKYINQSLTRSLSPASPENLDCEMVEQHTW